MLLRITNRCHGGCKHCMIDASSPDGEHMTMETFERALDFCERLDVKILLVSGGEPFENPDVFRMAARLREVALDRMFMPAFASNGHFALNDETLAAVRETRIGVQVTCDPRFYGRVVLEDRFSGDDQFRYVDRIQAVFPCRRTRENSVAVTRNTPGCFNIRSATRSMGYQKGQLLLALQGRICCPSINIDGTVVAGETDTCHPIGTVDSTIEEIEEGLRTMRCNRCGLVKNLEPSYLEAIGEQA